MRIRSIGLGIMAAAFIFGGMTFSAAEAKAAYCEDVISARADRLVTLLYRGALFRGPDAPGLRNWTSDLRMDPSIAKYSEIARAFGESEEFRYNVQGRRSSREIVRNLYRTILGREPEAQGLRQWTLELDRGYAGDVVAGIAASEESRQRNMSSCY